MKVPRLFIALALGLGHPVSSPMVERANTIRVVDGDSINIGNERHRLLGIDAPEKAQRCRRADGTVWQCGRAATKALRAKIGANQIACKGQKRDRYDRRLSICRVGDINLNAWMVRQGWAVAYRKYAPLYIREENAARHARLMIWSGAFVMPRNWRRGKRLQGE